jgi:F-type H+-transporting ATPase subunit delta
MAESVTIARPYAQAVFRLVRMASRWRLGRSVCSGFPPSRRIRRWQKSSVTRSFLPARLPICSLHLPAKRGTRSCRRSSACWPKTSASTSFPRSAKSTKQLKSADEGIKEAVITSAFPLDDAQLARLVKQLESHFGAHLQPRVEVDASLIGGVKVAVGDQILDASVRGKLDAMATALKN